MSTHIQNSFRLLAFMLFRVLTFQVLSILCQSDLVTESPKLTLHAFQADGWIVNRISLLANPNQVRPKRFWGVYTKLKIFNMTSYKKGMFQTGKDVSSSSGYLLYHGFHFISVSCSNTVLFPQLFTLMQILSL
jgi:hypothetical protein